MSLALRNAFGCTEAIIADNGSLNLFYKVADIFNNDLRIKFSGKEDDFDSINWNFKFKGHKLTLHYNIYSGISVFPTKISEADNKDNKAVVELANALEEKLSGLQEQRSIA